MNDLKYGGKLSNKNRFAVLICLITGLLGVAIFRHLFPAIKGELSDTFFIASLVVMSIHVIWKNK